MQNSQRVLLAKPRIAPMARRRDGDIAPYRNGTAPRGTRCARGNGAHVVRAGEGARQRDRTRGAATGPRVVRTATGRGRGAPGVYADARGRKKGS